MMTSWNMSKEEYQWQLRDGWLPDRDYVFVSYSRQDWDKVYPCVMALRSRGINVYIDIEFMENQSSSWLKNFQERLFRDSGCKGIVTFLSINYMRSYACLVEQMSNRTNRMRKRMGKPLPMFYVALDPELGTLQQMSAHIYTDQILRESMKGRVEISPPEYMVLQKFILDSHIDGYQTEESVQELLDDIHDKHDVVTTMYELIFCKATDMPSIQVFEGAEKCAQLLTDNFTNSKNDAIKLNILGNLKNTAQEKPWDDVSEEPPTKHVEERALPEEELPMDAQALYDLAGRYKVGRGVEKSLKKAAEYLQKAAEQGHTEAQYYLAVQYRKGQGVKTSLEKAVEWYLRAAEQGHMEAQYHLALQYEKGAGVEQSGAKTLYWVRKAAEQGHAGAQYMTGQCYANGKGTSKDWAQAACWYEKAAKQQHYYAQYNLAFLYKKGQGVKRSDEQAAYWFRQAAAQGHRVSQEKLRLF